MKFLYYKSLNVKFWPTPLSYLKRARSLIIPTNLSSSASSSLNLSNIKLEYNTEPANQYITTKNVDLTQNFTFSEESINTSAGLILDFTKVYQNISPSIGINQNFTFVNTDNSLGLINYNPVFYFVDNNTNISNLSTSSNNFFVTSSVAFNSIEKNIFNTIIDNNISLHSLTNIFSIDPLSSSFGIRKIDYDIYSFDGINSNFALQNLNYNIDSIDTNNNNLNINTLDYNLYSVDRIDKKFNLENLNYLYENDYSLNSIQSKTFNYLTDNDFISFVTSTLYAPDYSVLKFESFSDIKLQKTEYELNILNTFLNKNINYLNYDNDYKEILNFNFGLKNFENLISPEETNTSFFLKTTD